MDFKRVSFLVGCFVFGLVGLFTEVKGGNVLHKSKCNYTAIYNFGDSNSDTGTTSAAFTEIYPPNGENFPGNFPKRNCDGRLIIDFIAEELELPYLSAYLDSIGSSYNHGANFAMGGSSIRQGGFNEVFLSLQISQFRQFKFRTMALYNQSSNNSADACFKSRLPKSMDFSKALYTLDIGQNDLSFGFMNSDQHPVRASIPDILTKFSQGVQKLYNEGARLFWIHNTGPIGCFPRTNQQHKPNPQELDSAGCRKSENEITQEFNKQLKDLVFQLRKELPTAKFTYVDVYSAKYELIKNARNQGFVNPKKFCCGTTKSIRVDCGKKKIKNGKEEYNKCKTPWKYISWDGVHYSEAANRWLATRILNGSFSDPPVPISMACN
ncbi:GDSL esterase/lipase At3g27950-like [Gastrolobium bilobum]|uniref:GDSL esterase/lipase At3g27950-like n=1 Tax=Gastrolobium bilobum TaxID=150636 RepID=UPI002AB17B4C|nr:GDSL esterase/lipase At3g27950-like [Gastrolobium bilobum]